MEIEEWEPIVETDRYEASTYGCIRNVKTGLILRGTLDERGRLKVLLHINGRPCSRYVKRLVAEAFWGKIPEGFFVYQKNGDTTNCAIDNLELGTRSEIIKHSYTVGKRNANNMRAVRCVDTGERYSSIAECSRRTGLNQSTICRNVNGSTYRTKSGRRFEPIDI